MFKRNRQSKDRKRSDASQILNAGIHAPNFSLPNQSGEKVTIKDFFGAPLILVFYPAAFSPVCGDQLVLYNEIMPLFEEHNARLLAISVDGNWCHQAFSKANNFQFNLLSDFEPKGDVARAYGVYDVHAGICKRALFVIDHQGIIRWSYVSPIGVNPGADGILNALESL